MTVNTHLTNKLKPMKKFLLLAAVVAMTGMTAQALDLTLEDLSSGWNAEYDAATKTITYADAWSGKGWWLEDTDYSAYTDVVIEVEPLTIQAKIVCEYIDVNSSETGMFNIGATELTCALSAEGKAHTKQIYIQCGSLTDAPSITLISAKLVDNSGKAPDLVIWSGEQQIDWWSNAVVLPPSMFTNLEAGDELAIDYTITGEYGSIKLLEVMAGWSENKILPACASLPNYQPEYETLFLGNNGESGTFKLSMDEENVEIVKNPANVQFMITGDGVIVTKVEIVKPTSVEKIEGTVSANGQMYNIYGMPVDSNYKGIVIKDGKKYIVR